MGAEVTNVEITKEMIEAAARYADIHLEGLTIVRIDTSRLAEGMLKAAFPARETVP